SLSLSSSPSPLPLPVPLVAQPVSAVPVVVTSAFDHAFPFKLPPRVMAAPARMFPWKAEVVVVTACETHHVTLHACPPPAMTTEKLVPVSAPVRLPILNVQTALALPPASRVNVTSVAVKAAPVQKTPGASVTETGMVLSR